jgi:hypothetical protein
MSNCRETNVNKIDCVVCVCVCVCVFFGGGGSPDGCDVRDPEVLKSSAY